MWNFSSRFVICLNVAVNSIIISASALKSAPNVVVVGSGWGGWGTAATLLSEMNCKVTLIDAIADPSSSNAESSMYTTLYGNRKPFELGTKGFWKDYPNIYDLVEKLGLKEDETFTECTKSSFYSPFGLEATAPVFSSYPKLPSPLGQIFASFSLFERLPVYDRVSIAGLLYAMIDFNKDEKTFIKYDKMTANELFIRCGVSKRLVEDFLKPTLLVGLFKPPEELSAAITLELLYFYALAHQTSFDVKWIKRKSINSVIINPLAEKLKKNFDLTILGNSKVDKINLDDKTNKIKSISFTTRKENGKYEQNVINDIDACVLAVGANGLKGILRNSPEIAKISPELTAAASLNGIDVIACRLWLDKVVPTNTPANVLSRFAGLRGAGGTFFMLDQLQGNTLPLWGGTEPQGSVVACDFYNAGELLHLSEKDLVSLLIDDLLPKAVKEFSSAKVVDAIVVKCPQAVNWFGPGSFLKRPPLSIPSVPNLAMAGDWVRMGTWEHGSKGLCQERAFVSGIQAANSLARSGALGIENKFKRGSVLPVRDDELQVKIGRSVNQIAKSCISLEPKK